MWKFLITTIKTIYQKNHVAIYKKQFQGVMYITK